MPARPEVVNRPSLRIPPLETVINRKIVCHIHANRQLLHKDAKSGAETEEPVAGITDVKAAADRILDHRSIKEQVDRKRILEDRIAELDGIVPQ